MENILLLITRIVGEIVDSSALGRNKSFMNLQILVADFCRNMRGTGIGENSQPGSRTPKQGTPAGTQPPICKGQINGIGKSQLLLYVHEDADISCRDPKPRLGWGTTPLTFTPH